MPASELVPGDLLIVAAGDAVPADAKLLEAHSLQVNEASLTGESLPVAKTVGEVPAESPLGERSDMIFSGTFVTA